MGAYIANIFRIFNPIELVFTFVMLFAVNAGFYYFATGNLPVAIVIGIVGMLFFFHVFAYKTRVLKNYQANLNDLMKYVTNVTFFLQIGENVYHSLVSSKVTLNKEIQNRVQATIDTLDTEAVLDTQSFQQYDFASVDQFHQNLNVKYNHGGNARDLFGTIQANMMNELKKRDELYKRRKGFALNVYVMLGMVGIMLVVLRTMVGSMWEIFLSYTLFSSIVLCMTYGAVLLNLYLLQKKVNDIKVQV